MQVSERDTSLRQADRLSSWGQAGTLVTGDTSRAVSMQTGDLADATYKVYTLSFNANLPAGGAQATATISFVVNGIPAVRQVTVGQSVTISGAADAVSVRIVDSTPASWNNAGQSYAVSVTCVPGTRAGKEYPLLNDVNGNASPGTGLYQLTGGPVHLVVNVPQGAGVNGVWFACAPSATSTTIAWQSPNAVKSWEFTISTFEAPIWIPMPAGSTGLLLFAAGAGGTLEASIIWTIDG